jgi:hypothetical protein
MRKQRACVFMILCRQGPFGVLQAYENTNANKPMYGIVAVEEVPLVRQKVTPSLKERVYQGFDELFGLHTASYPLALYFDTFSLHCAATLLFWIENPHFFPIILFFFFSQVVFDQKGSFLIQRYPPCFDWSFLICAFLP